MQSLLRNYYVIFTLLLRYYHAMITLLSRHYHVVVDRLFFCCNLGGHYCSRGLCSAKLKRIALALEDLDAAIEVHIPYFDTNILTIFLRYFNDILTIF